MTSTQYTRHPFVLYHYRPSPLPFTKACRSLFQWHMIFFLVMHFHTCRPYYKQVPILWVQSTTVSLNVLFSCTYHLLMPVNEKISIITRKLDITVILVKTFTYIALTNYYVFSTTINTIILFVTALHMTTFLAYMWHTPNVHNKQPSISTLLAVIFVGVVTYQVPMFYMGDFYHGSITITCASLSAFVLYFRLPERLSPGTFDLIGASHQLMHVFVCINNIALISFIVQQHHLYMSKMTGITG